MGLEALNRILAKDDKVNNQSLLYLLQTLGEKRLFTAEEFNDIRDALKYLSENGGGTEWQKTRFTYIGGSQIFLFTFTELKLVFVNGVEIHPSEYTIGVNQIDFQDKLQINNKILIYYV